MKNSLSVILFSAALSVPALLPAAPQASSAEHVLVYHEAGRFAGWPANNGIWVWGDEIAVAFTRGWFKHDPNEHSRDEDKPTETVIGRSRDGGVTWSIEPLALKRENPSPAPGGIDFSHPDFAMRVQDDMFWYSLDRARTWRGPYSFPDFKLGDRLTSRTDYVVGGPDDCHIFLSVRDRQVQSGIADRAFAVRTRDGGKTFEFLGWMAGDGPAVARSVMPATVRADNGTLVSLLRRRYDLKSAHRHDLNWIDAFISRDDGQSWTRAARVTHTDHVGRNGNPPSLVKLRDGRLAAVYGVRRQPCGIRARVSGDNGVSWGPELVLRDDARTWDIGYCRSVVRGDGKVVTVYYYATADNFENHIAATIWSP